MHKYNSLRPLIKLKEYGRNVHTMVANLMQVEDRESRNQQAKALIELMKQFNPAVKDTNDVMQKLWDDLYIMSDFKLDVDGPYPMPDPVLLQKRPQHMGYSSSRIKMRHYGKNIELLASKINDSTSGEERENATAYIARLMRTFYSQYNRETVDDVVIIQDLKNISNGNLTIDPEKVKSENLFDVQVKERRLNPESRPARENNRGKNNNFGNNNRNNNRNNRNNRNNNRKSK